MFVLHHSLRAWSLLPPESTPLEMLSVRTPPPTMMARAASWKPGETAPSYLDGKMAGDIGFDPLGLAALARPFSLGPQSGMASLRLNPALFAKSVEERQQAFAGLTSKERESAVLWMREAEIKHARLAMLAAAGWPLAELWNGGSLYTTDGRAPSLFNGGLLEGFTPIVLLAAAAVAGFFELQLWSQWSERENETWIAEPKEPLVPGDLGFDPLGVAAEEGAYRINELKLQEIKNGRLAMMAITGFAVQEFFWGTPVIEQTPFFFGR